MIDFNLIKSSFDQWLANQVLIDDKESLLNLNVLVIAVLGKVFFFVFKFNF
jgi:hypothetical protein